MEMQRTPQNVIKTFIATLCDTNWWDRQNDKGKAAIDEAIRACSSFTGMDDVINNMVYDRSRSSSGDAFLKNYCGINVNNADSGAITGSDAGGSVVKTKDSVVQGSGRHTNFNQNSFQVNGTTFQLYDTTFSNLNATQKQIWQYMETWWAKGSLDLIAESYGSDFNLNGKTVYVTFDSVIKGGAAMTLRLDDDHWLLTLSDVAYASLIAHELTHAVMDVKDGAYAIPIFLKEGLAELTRGIDNKRNNIPTLAQYSSNLQYYLNVANEEALDQNESERYKMYDAGYMFLRYLAKQGASNHPAPALFDNEDNNQQNTTSGKVLKALAGNDTIGNWGNYVTLNGGTGNDSVFNDQQGYNSLIDTGDGNDTIWNWGTNSTLNGGTGNDSISNHNIYVTMNGSSGNDTLINWEGSAYVKMSGDDGEDYLQNHGYDVTIDGGAGNDSVYNEGNSAFINTGVGNDTVRNWQGTYLRIELGDGKDSIENAIGHNTTINAGYGDDYINNSSSNYVSIYAGYGNDFVWNWEGNGTTVELSEGNDSITNWHGSSSTIFGGGGEDFIHNNDANYSSIDAGDGNDFIRNESSQQATLSGGSGNDTISIDGSSSHTMIKYAQGDGYDWIYGYNSGDTISLGGGYYTRETVGSSVVVNVIGSGAMTLDGASNKDIYITGGILSVTAIFTEGADYYSNSTSNTVLSALGGNDSIYQSGRSDYVTVDGGAGNDTIVGRYWNSSLSGGAGDDVIDISAGDVDRATINGGTGNDTIFLDNYDGYNYVQYASGDGNDAIYYLQSNDTISLGGGYYTRETLGNHLIVSVIGSGSMSLIDASNKTIHIIGGTPTVLPTFTEGDDYYSNSTSNTMLSALGGNDSISQSGRSDYVTVNGGAGNDTIVGRYWNSSLFGGAGNDVIDISAGDVDGATINGGTGDDKIYLDAYDGYNYLQYANGEGNDTIYGIRARDTLQITGSSYTKATVGSDLRLNVDSGSILVKDGATIGFTIDGTLNGSYTTYDTVISGTSGNDSIYSANVRYVTIYAGAGADSITGNYYSSKIYGDAGNDYINVVDEDVYRWSDSHLLLVSKYLKLTNVWEENLSNTIDGGAGDDTINIIGFGSSYINGGNGDDRISHAGDNVCLPGRTIKGGKGNDIIYGIGDKSVVGDAQGYQGFPKSGTRYEYSYGDGSDTIYNYHSLDTISIADNSYYTRETVGSNVIVSVIGSGSIVLSNASTETINIAGGTPTVLPTFTEGNDYYSNSTASTVLNALGGNDTISISNSGDYVLVNAGDGNDSIHASDGDYMTINGGAGSDTVTGAYWSSKIYAGSGNDLVSIGGSYSNTIDGGDGADTIYSYGGSVNGGAGADKISVSSSATIKGGTGDDTIYGSSNYSVRYQYAQGDGNDYIYNYSSGDTISLGGGYYTRETVGSNVIVSVIGSGAMTLNGASDKNVYITGGTPTVTVIDIKNFTSNTSINGTAENDTIQSRASRVTIYGGTGDDFISCDGTLPGGSSYSQVIYDNVVYAGAGNDTVYLNFNSGTSVYGGDGNDSIALNWTNADRTITISGGNGNDTINDLEGGNHGAVIFGDAGDDYIVAQSDEQTINGGLGNDTITVTDPGLTHLSRVYQYTNGDGNDVIYDFNGTLKVTGGSYTTVKSGNDLRVNVGSGSILIKNADTLDVNIDGIPVAIFTEGNDSYSNSTASTVLNALGGNDMINNSANNVTINGGAGADKITSSASSVAANGGAGNDSIFGSYKYSTIDGGADADHISVSASHSYINGGAGNDFIRVRSNSGISMTDFTEGSGESSGVTIVGGTGNDVIYNDANTSLKMLVGVLYKYSSGDGNDTIYGVKAGDTISLGGGYYTRETVGSNVIVSVIGSGAMTLSGASDKNVYITGGTLSVPATFTEDADYYSNSTANTVLSALSGNDTINNSANNVTISGGKGNDRISLSSGANNNFIKYASGDGYDTIYGYNSNDSISVTGDSYTTSTVGSDVIVSVGSGSMKLIGAAGQSLNIYPTIPPASVVTQQEVIKKFMGVLDTVTSSGMSALNQAVNVASGGYFLNAQAAVNQMVSDCRNSSSATNFLRIYCDINLDNEDTGAITGYDAGGSATQINRNAIVPESGSAHSFTGDNFQTNGLTVQLANIKNNRYSPMSYGNLTNSAQQYIWQAFETWWASASLDLIAQSYGDNYSFNSIRNKTLYLGFFNEPAQNNGITLAWTNTSLDKKDLVMAVNMSAYGDVIEDNADGKTESWGDRAYLDRTIAHEMTHAVMRAAIDNFRDLPQFITEGMAELTHGVDDERESDILTLARNPYILQSSLSMLPGTGERYSYAGGYMFLRYLAKQASENYTSAANIGSTYGSHNIGNGSVAAPTGISISGDALTVSTAFRDSVLDLADYVSKVKKVDATKLTGGIMITGNESANTIKAGSGADTISGNSGNDKISGGAGNDILFGDAGNDSIVGGAGNDSISGGSGKDTLTGGAGNDIFIYSADSDYITDYTAGQDKIKLLNGSITGASVSGSNVVLEVGTGSITVKSGKGKQITVIDGNDNETIHLYPLSTLPAGISVSGAVLTASSVFSGSKIDLADYASTVTKVNASALSRGVSIVGTAAANSIKGGKSADTISGGAGNDTVSLGGGADVYIYSGGNDLIQDYKAGEDKIKLSSGSVTGASLSGTNVVLKTSGGNITVKGGKNKKITVINASGNETSQVYPISPYPAGISVSGAVLTASSVFSGSKIDLADYASTVTKVNASALSRGVSIVGTAAANSIKGGKSADTISGGAGNDTVSLGGGADIYIYSSGNDLIQDYKAGEDKIKLASAYITGSSLSSTNVILKTSGGNITVKGGKNKNITVIDSSGKTTTQKYGNSGASALWFTEDDTNFIGENNLDAISAEKYEVTQLETANAETLAQSETLITYADK